MIPAIYYKETEYLQSASTIEAKIAAYRAIIDALNAQLLTMSIQDTPIHEYMLNDGQTIIKTTYTSLEAIMKTIAMLEYQVNRLINRNTRVARSIPGENFIGRRFW